MMRSAFRRLPAVIVAVVFTLGAAAQPRYSDSGPEPMLARTFDLIEHDKLDAALQQTEAMIRAYPTFHLAYLIKGDLLLARTKPLTAFGQGGMREARAKVADLRDEAIARLHAYHRKPPTDYVPRYLIQMQPNQKYAIVVDTQKSRLYLYRNDHGTPRFVADYYVSQGKLGANKTREGDQKTPIGIYHVTAHLPANKLSAFYGIGAFPISYPNEWDRRMGRNGHGIWLHGTPPNTFSRPPKASEGCVVLANEDLHALAGDLQVGLTPVIISNSIEWLSLDDWQAERKALLNMLDEWRRDWESLDIDRYASHYSRKFESDHLGYKGWIDHKRAVNAGKTWIKVSTDNISMFRNPGHEDYVVTTFEQHYQSNNLSDVMTKELYWIKEDGRWKIIHEGPG
jgi:murein L,D-transpeptidase YafK